MALFLSAETSRPEIVSQIESMYKSGLPQRAIGERLGLRTETISRIMIRNNIPRGRNVNMKGDKNPAWKGDGVGYTQLHNRVRKLFGTPQRCEVCGSENDPTTVYEWANLTGHYEDPHDYKRMCRSCHWKYDKRIDNFNGIKPYTYRSRTGPRGTRRVYPQPTSRLSEHDRIKPKAER